MSSGITTDGRSARAMTDMIGEIFDPAETAVASFETEDGGPWLLEAYFASQPDETAIRNLLRPIVGEEADKGVFLPLDQQDWVKASLEGLKPVRAGRIFVHGSHDRDQRRPSDIAIEIEAGLAFGTGHHGHDPELPARLRRRAEACARPATCSMSAPARASWPLRRRRP